MPTPPRPNPTALLQNYNYVFAPTLANYLAPTAAEITATGSLDCTNIFFTSSANPAQSTNAVTRASRMGDGATYQAIGLTSFTWGDLHYPFNMQAASGSDQLKAWTTFGSGAGVNGYMIYRSGIVLTQAFVAAQYVWVYPIGIGPGLPIPEGDGEAAEQGVTQTVVITGPPSGRVAIAS